MLLEQISNFRFIETSSRCAYSMALKEHLVMRVSSYRKSSLYPLSSLGMCDMSENVSRQAGNRPLFRHRPRPRAQNPRQFDRSTRSAPLSLLKGGRKGGSDNTSQSTKWELSRELPEIVEKHDPNKTANTQSSVEILCIAS